MKVIEANSNRLILQTQRYRVKFLDFTNNLNGIAGWLTLPVLLVVLWHESASLDELRNYLVLFLVVITLGVGGGLGYIFLNQKENMYEIDSYISNQNNNILSSEYRSIWGSKKQEICSLSDVCRIHLEIFSETFPKEVIPNHPPTELKTSYQVKLELASGKEMILEYNSISSFSSDEVQNVFRGLIKQTNDAIKELRYFLDIT